MIGKGLLSPRSVRHDAWKRIALHVVLAALLVYPVYFALLFAGDTWLGSQSLINEYLFESRRRVLLGLVDVARATAPVVIGFTIAAAVAVQLGSAGRLGRPLRVLIAAAATFGIAAALGYAAVQCALYSITAGLALLIPLALRGLRHE